MANEVTVPKVEVIENGKSVSQERIDPSVAQFIMQASQTAQLVKMRKLEESKSPIGSKSLKYTVGTETKKIVLDHPWISLSLINDGDADVYITIGGDEHDLQDEVSVEKDEVFDFDATYPKIRRFLMKTSSGTAAVRIHGKVGRDDR